jgi:hypothetical protein
MAITAAISLGTDNYWPEGLGDPVGLLSLCLIAKVHCPNIHMWVLRDIDIYEVRFNISLC